MIFILSIKNEIKFILNKRLKLRTKNAHIKICRKKPIRQINFHAKVRRKNYSQSMFFFKEFDLKINAFKQIVESRFLYQQN